MPGPTQSRAARRGRSEPGRTAVGAWASLLATRVSGIPHLTHRVGLRHQSLEVVHEPLAAVLRVLVMPAEMDRFFRADLLAVAAEDAAELVDLEHERVAVPLLVLARHELDAIRRTDGGTQAAGDALGLAVFRGEHPMGAPPASRERLALLGVLRRDLVWPHEVPERVPHARERGAHVAGLLARTFENLDASRHQRGPMAESRARSAASWRR